jgi:hypothetical protein
MNKERQHIPNHAAVATLYDLAYLYSSVVPLEEAKVSANEL